MTEPIDEQRIHAAAQRYVAAAHAMQTGVKLKMQKDPNDCSPKHLRVGVNSALVETSALASILMAKGIFTETEYREALADFMEREVESYRKELGLPDNVGLA